MTGQENGDLLLQVTAWAGLTVNVIQCFVHTVINVEQWQKYGQLWWDFEGKTCIYFMGPCNLQKYHSLTIYTIPLKSLKIPKGG